MKKLYPPLVGILLLGPLPFTPALAWDYEGHRVANELALTSLPANFPAFIRAPAAQSRIVFLGGEADRWRNVADLPLRQANGPDHYIDLEELGLYDLKPDTLPLLRYDFVAVLARTRAAHPEKFPPIDPARNEDHTRELVGFLPWALTENYEKLKSAFSYLKTLEADGTPEEVADAQQNILYMMGVMGHFAADAAQPLHTTIHHHGWVGPNPEGYTTNSGIHQWIDGGFFSQTGGLDAKALRGSLRPAQVLPDGGRGEEIFRAVSGFIAEQHKQVEPLFRLYKENKLSGEGDTGREGKAFLEGQLVRGGQLLGDLWLSAWRHAPDDRYLREQLLRRMNNSRSSGAPAGPH